MSTGPSEFGTSWPPETQRFRFWVPDTGKPISVAVDEFEMEGKCRAYQRINCCPLDPRYDYRWYGETISTNETRSGVRFSLKETALPCERCWEVKTRERAIRLLVKNVIDYDLAESATVQITGDNRGFEEAVVRVCMENRREPELQNIKRIAAQAIEIRRAQLDSIGLGASTGWTEQQTVEFTDALSAYIEDDLAGYDSRTAR